MPSSNTLTLVEKMEVQQEDDGEFSYEDKKYKFLFWEFETPFIWKNILEMTVFHALTLYILATHPYLEKPGVILYAALVGIIAEFGVTGGVHRYWTHRSYKAKLPLRIILLLCYSVTGQYSIKQWVRDHRVHHKYSETNADPHNSRRGFFYSHVGWLMMEKHPEVIRKGRKIDNSDLFEDPVVVFHQRHFVWLKLLFCFILPTIVPPLVWDESWIVSIKVVAIARYMLWLNYTWLVNSVAHLWGSKPYDKKISPVENLTISVLTNGEGYHNYHHTFPWDYRAAELGKYLNLTTLLLNFFQKIGWAYDMKITSPELVKKVVKSNGDGSHYKWGHEVTEEDAKVIMKGL